MPRTGRRPGAAGTRDKVLAAARAQFARKGYEGATIRGIAAAARVDPRLVVHYFGSKDGAFRAAMDFPFDPSEVIPVLMKPGLDGLGVRIARFFLDLWDSPAGGRALALLRSVVASEEAAALLREFATREILGRLAQALELDHPQVRASLVASQLIGIAMLRYVVRAEPLASARADRLSRWIGPALQRYFTDPTAIGSR